jgi:hypothetical protein
MITGHVPAVRVPPDHAASRRAAAVPACGSVENCRDPDPAPPARRPAAASGVPPQAELGGPRPPRDPGQRATESPSSGAAAAGHPGHDRALAPRHPPPALGRQIHARQERPPGHPPEHQGPGSPAGPRKPQLGIPPDPRGAGRPGREGSGVDGVGDPEERRNRPRAAADRAYLVAVPAFSGRRESWRATSSRPTCPAAPRPTSSP